MQIVAGKKTVNLVFTTRKIVAITNLLKGKNFEELYFTAMNDLNLDALSKIIFTFAEDEIGAKSFQRSEDVYDFIDEYKKEQDKAYIDLFREIAEAINEEGFFNQKMSKKALKDRIENPLSSLDMNELLRSSTEKAMTTTVQNVVQEQMV